MASAYGRTYGLTTWGMRDGKQVWRVTWDERPDMVADVTGPHETGAALIKLTPPVLAHLPWKRRAESRG